MRIGPKRGPPEGDGDGPTGKRAKTGELAAVKAALAKSERELARLRYCMQWKIQCTKCGGWCHTVDECPIHDPNRTMPDDVLIRTIAHQPTFKESVDQSVTLRKRLADPAVYVPVLIERYPSLHLNRPLIQRLMDIVGEFRLYRQGWTLEGHDTRAPPAVDGDGNVTPVQRLYELYQAKDLKGWIDGTKPVHTFNATALWGFCDEDDHEDFCYGYWYYNMDTATKHIHRTHYIHDDDGERELNESVNTIKTWWFTYPVDVSVVNGGLLVLNREYYENEVDEELGSPAIVYVDIVNNDYREFKVEEGSTTFYVEPTPNGVCYVVNEKEHSVKGFVTSHSVDAMGREVNPNTDSSPTFVVQRPQVNDPVDVCSDPSGRVYVADGSTVKIFTKGPVPDDPGAILEREIGIANGRSVRGVCVEPEPSGHVYVLCNRTIHVFTKTGDAVRTMQIPDARGGSMWMSPGPQGHLYVCMPPKRRRKDKVSVLSKTNGTVVRTLVSTGWVHGGCVGPDGRVYVAHTHGIDVFLPPLR